MTTLNPHVNTSIESFAIVDENNGRKVYVQLNISNDIGLRLETPLELKGAERVLRELAKAIDVVRKASKGADKIPEGHVISLSWGCTSAESPNGFCAYEPEEDPCRDFCIYCGNPEERK